jgi:hypothetical protein
MPRLSNKDYLATRLAFRDVDAWLHALDLDDFIAVHRFFAPAKQFTDEEALAHRRAVTAKDPSLPHRVGKILRKQPVKASVAEQQVAREVGAGAGAPVAVGSAGREQQLIVRGVLRPEIDLRKLAQIISLDMRKPVGERLIDRVQRHDQDEAA